MEPLECETRDVAPQLTQNPLVHGQSKSSRTSKACNNCRKRKAKCNGETPCLLCSEKNVECIYRVQTRVRQNAAFYARRRRMREPRTRGIRIDPSSHDKFWTRDLDFLAGVYATEETTSASCPLQLFYGPSSNFSLLLQIHHHTNTLTESSATTSSQATEALLRFQYDKLFFGKHSGLTEPLASPASSHSQSWNQGMLDYSIWDCNSVPALLPPHLPFEFLDRVLAVDYPFLPFLDGSHLRRITQLMLEASQHDLSLQDHAIVIAMLALGATFTEHCQWAEILFSRARGISELLNEAFQLQVGRPNSAYLLAGTAHRKAIAVGLHKELPSQIRSLSPFQVEQRRLTFWALDTFESMICYALGRPICTLSEDVITIPQPRNPFLIYMATLTRIIAKCAKLIYYQTNKPIEALWSASRRLKCELDQFQRNLPVQLAIKRDGDDLSCESVSHFLLTNVYYHTVILLFRPFIIFRARQQKRGAESPSQNTTTTGSECLDDDMPWLLEACRYAAEAARSLLRFIVASYDSCPVTKDLRHNAFYIDSACFLLALNILGNGSHISEDALLIYSGLNCLSQMLPSRWAALSNSSSAIKEILSLINKEIEDSPMARNDTTLCLAAPNDLPSESIIRGIICDSLDWIPDIF
ncbi:hypothetical protein BJY00DRAFT_322040 [Aspergillus carlsbadensis]|nr:hypothetical protein BJY00DRAFT_322040 [Aspergillus carlsbadensis]